MKSRIHEVVYLLLFSTFLWTVGLAQYASTAEDEEKSTFLWPEGKSLAVSLSFDDGRASQLDRGIPILNKYGVRATFFVNPSNITERLEDWKLALAQGHEIASHTMTHPCSGNFVWSRRNALEELSLKDIAKEIDQAGDAIKRLFGIAPQTFAYPCGQKFVGRGEAVNSYVPLVAKRFLTGRGWRDEAANDPSFCDLAQILGVELDGLSFREAQSWIEQTRKEGYWLVFCGHDIGGPGRQNTLDTTLEALCRYSQDPAKGVWIDSVERVAAFIRARRETE